MPRDDFSPHVKETLAKRVAYHCSNPKCSVITTGPHTDAEKSINIGVASHITAAASGGPRYDALFTPEQRSSIGNGIWLCQSCAKLIDSDVLEYNVAKLNEWKSQAEQKTLELMKYTDQTTFYPQPEKAMHTPIPIIANLPYEIARERMINSGWQPIMQHWSYPSRNLTLQAGDGKYFWSKGFHEIINACPTGLGFCTFGFSDVYKNKFVIVTAGEVLEDEGVFAHVWSWYFKDIS